MLSDVRDKAYMLHYICYGSEEYKMSYQEDKVLCPSPGDIHPAISESDYFKDGTDNPATLNRERFAALSNTTH